MEEFGKSKETTSPTRQSHRLSISGTGYMALRVEARVTASDSCS